MLCCAVLQGSNPPLSHVLGPLLAALLVSLVALVCVAAAWRCGGLRGLGEQRLCWLWCACNATGTAAPCMCGESQLELGVLLACTQTG